MNNQIRLPPASPLVPISNKKKRCINNQESYEEPDTYLSISNETPKNDSLKFPEVLKSESSIKSVSHSIQLNHLHKIKSIKRQKSLCERKIIEVEHVHIVKEEYSPPCTVIDFLCD